jgi:Steigviridae/Suoliviridae L,D-carboxypeptidase/transpeptidase
MNLYLSRGPVEASGVYGQLVCEGGPTFASLENTACYIPAGAYKLSWHASPHLGGAVVPMLNDVPGRTEILIHWGNVEACSEGCILIGLNRDGNAIDSTQTAIARLSDYIRSQDPTLADSFITIA